MSSAICTVDNKKLDAVFHALADRTRRSMLAQLARAPARVTHLAEPYAMILPAASKHLKVLERAGLVERSIEGRVHRCSINADSLRDIQQWVDRYQAFWESTLDALAEHVEGEQ